MPPKCSYKYKEIKLLESFFIIKKKPQQQKFYVIKDIKRTNKHNSIIHTICQLIHRNQQQHHQQP